MTAQTYRQVISSAINDLPAEALIEIIDFLHAIRQRSLRQQARYDSLSVALNQLSQSESHHLEQEFADYEQLYPIE